MQGVPYFNASIGSLHPAMFKCFKLNELVKNCLNDGGTSLPFFVLNELWETFRWARCVEQPLNRAPNKFSKVISVDDKSRYSRLFGCARKLCKFCKEHEIAFQYSYMVIHFSLTVMSSFRMLPLKSKYVNVLDILWFSDKECDIWLTPFAVSPQWDKASLHKPFDTFAIGPARWIAPVGMEGLWLVWSAFDWILVMNHVQDYSSFQYVTFLRNWWVIYGGNENKMVE